MIIATAYDDGSGVLAIDSETQESVSTGSVDAARETLIAKVRDHARQRGHTMRVLAVDPSGRWELDVHADGSVHPAAASDDDAPSEPTTTPDEPDTAETPVYVEPQRPTPAPAPTTPAPPSPAPPVTAARDQPNEMTRRAAREQSFLTSPQRTEAPATTGWRGMLASLGIKVSPSAAEISRRDDVRAVSRHWAGPRTIAVVNGKGGAGKALQVDEPVLTPTGWMPIGSLHVGDLVIGRDGLAYPVMGVYPQGVQDLYDVALTDGTTIRATGDHLWEVETPADRHRAASCAAPDCARPVLATALCGAHYKQQWRGNPFKAIRTGAYAKVARSSTGARVMTTRQIADAGLGVDRGIRGMRHRFFLPVAAPIKFDPVDLPLDPYLVGLLLGDGCLTSGSPMISTADDAIRSAVENLIPSGTYLTRKTRYDYRIARSAHSGPNPLTDRLRALGMWGVNSATKTIPREYLYADADARLAVLQGLLDSDGCVANRGAAVALTTCSDDLAAGAQFLAESLGCVVTTGRGRGSYRLPTGKIVEGMDYTRLTITTPPGMEPFRLERKAAGLRDDRQRPPYRAIQSITAAGRGEAVCIAVASPDHLFLARNCVPTHNTPTTAMLAAVMARYGGGGVLAWDNNDTRGTLGWRTEPGAHEAHVRDLLPHVDRLMDPSARAADIAAYVHHQSVDKYDVLRSNPASLPGDQRLTRDDFDAVHRVASRYFRLMLIDSGNAEDAPHWLRMIDHADQLVVATTTRSDHAEAARLLLNSLHERDPRSAGLADGAVVVVSQADRDEKPAAEVAEHYRGLARAAVTIPYDRAMRADWLRYDALSAPTQRAWLRAAAAVAGGL